MCHIGRLVTSGVLQGFILRRWWMCFCACRWHQIGGNSWYAWGQGCHSEGLWHCEHKAHLEPYEIQGQMQRPALGKKEHLTVIQAGDWLVGKQLCWRNLGSWWTALTMGQQQHALAEKMGNNVLGSINRSIASRWREVVISFCLVLVRLHLEYCTRFCDPQYRKNIGKQKLIWWRANKLVRELEAGALALWGEGERAGFVQLAKRWLQGDLTKTCWCFWGDHWEDGVRQWS